MADSSSQPVSVDDLAALNDEIGALIGAGVPMEAGLEGFAVSASGDMADVSARLARRLGDGQTLSGALHEEKQLPRAYRAIIEAGRQSGRLSNALECLAEHSAKLVEIRQRVTVALIYPCVVLIAAYYLFWYFLGKLLPSMEGITGAPGTAPPDWWTAANRMHAAVTSLGHVPPALIVILFLWWLVGGWFASRSSGFPGVMLRCVPGVGGSLRLMHLANFTELAAILIEHNVPCDTAWPMAAEATGDPHLVAEAQRLAALEQPFNKGAIAAIGFPPFLSWMLAAGDRQGTMTATLRRVGTVYRRQAVARITRLKLLLPTAVTIVVAGGAVLLYALAVWIPVTEMMHGMGSQ